MKAKIFNILKIFIFISIGLFLVWIVLRDLTDKDIEEIKKSIAEANYWWIAFSFLLGVLSHLSRAYRWKMLLEPMGYKPRFWVLFHALMIGYLANSAIPRLGEVTRCGSLSKYDGIPFEKSFGTVIAERTVDMLSLMIIFFLTLFTQYNLISDYAQTRIIIPLQNKLSGLFGSSFLWIAGVAFLLLVLLLYRYRKKIAGLSFYTQIIKLLLGMWHGLISIKNVHRPWLFVFHSVFIWVMYYFTVFLCFYAFAETENLGLLAGLSALTFGSIGMIATQGGLGAYPLLIKETLSLYGIAPTIGFAFGWLVWIGQTFQILILGVISLIALPLIPKNNSNGRSNRPD